MVQQKLISIPEAAKIMGTTSEAIRNRLARQMMPRSLTHKIGRRVYFDKKALMDWIESNRRKSITKRLVFLYDSTIQPWHADLKAIQERLTELQAKGVKCELLDTKDMPEEQLEYWRTKASLASIWHHQQIRQPFGSKKKGGLPNFGKQAPALLVYQEGENVPVAIYPHGDISGDISIEDFLEEFVQS